MRSVLLMLVSAGMSFAQLQGIIDTHTHGDPDSSARSIDVLELARIAKAAGMRAIVLKNHYAPTVQAAYLVSEIVPGIQVFGAIALDRAVGGVNPEAVRQAAAFKGKKLRVVWMPTFDSENEVTFNKQNRPFVSIQRDGKLLPETMEVLKIIARENIVLATGHSSAAEDLLLVREAKKLGINAHHRHASDGEGSPYDDSRNAGGREDGRLHRTVRGRTAADGGCDGKIPVEVYVNAIRAVGADHVILSSDLGQAINPVHTEGWKLFLDILRKAGISDKELDTMDKTNPAALLGLQ